VSEVAQRYFQTLRNSPIADLLDMIERRAPLFMAAGGLVENSGTMRGPITRAEVERMREMARSGYSAQQIADEIGCCASAVRLRIRDIPYGRRLAGMRRRGLHT